MNSNRKNKEKTLSLLQLRLKAKCKEQSINLKVMACDILHTTYSTLYRDLNSNKKLKAPLVSRLAEYLGVSKEEIIEWHAYSEEEYFQPPQTSKKYSKNIFTICVFVLLTIALIYIMFFTRTSAPTPSTPITYTSKYSGNANDINLSNSIRLEDFHSAIYNYEFKNSIAKISGENITLNANIHITSITDPSIKYMGKFVATGIYLNGNAAVTYKTTVGSNQEAWIGTMMLKIPTIGPSEGYWLSIHNDPDDKSFGDFAFGDINMTRVVTHPTQ